MHMLNIKIWIFHFPCACATNVNTVADNLTVNLCVGFFITGLAGINSWHSQQEMCSAWSVECGRIKEKEKLHSQLRLAAIATAGESIGMGIHGRWNPTKEQVEMLERFYNDGIRTPSAVQIDDMAAHLRRYGPIQGKNVFYWFQNRKARLRNQLRQSLHQQQQQQIQHIQGPRLFLTSQSLAPPPDCTHSIRAIRPIPILPFSLPLPAHLTCQTEVEPSAEEEREIEILELFPLHPEGLALEANKKPHLQSEPE